MKKLFIIITLSSCSKVYTVALSIPTQGDDTIKGKYIVATVDKKNKVQTFYSDQYFKSLTKLKKLK